MSAAVRDSKLRNGCFDYVFVDDRLLLSATGEKSPRHLYDLDPDWNAELFHAHRIRSGQGLIALPIAANLRHCIPPRAAEQQASVERQLRWLHSQDPAVHSADLLAIYADDMEKPAAIGLDPDAPSHFEGFLSSLSEPP